MMSYQLYDWACRTRRILDPAFAHDTAAPGTKPGAPSAGHCAAVAIIVRTLIGGQYVSARVDGVSHWFNRYDTADSGWMDVDLTADQFGASRVKFEEAGKLYPGTIIRERSSLNDETIARARLLASRMVSP